MNTRSPATTNLRSTLLGNALFSGTSGLIAIVFHPAIARWMEVDYPIIFLVLGIGLLLFAGTILLIYRASTISPKAVKSIIVQDWLWVIGSGLLLIFRPFPLPDSAYWVIVIIALIVLDFALLQTRFLKRANLGETF